MCVIPACRDVYVVLIFTTWGLGLPPVSGTPLVNFLLNDYGYLYDVMQNTPQDNEQCGIGFGKTFSYFGNNHDSLLLNGNTRPYVDVNIPSVTIHSNLQYSDFTFRINVFPDVDPPSGTVFHYRSNTCSTDKIDELKFWLDHGDLYASKTVGGNVPETTLFPSGLNQIVANMWQFLGIGVEASTGKLVFMVNSFTLTADSSSTPQKAFNSPGTIRLGGGFVNTMGRFSGGMTCFGLHDELLDSNVKHDYTLDNCMRTTVWNSWPNGLPEAPDPSGCTQTGTAPANRTQGVFKLTGNDVTPSCHVTSTKSMVVRASAECALQCLQDESCLSFTVITSLSIKTCNLYSDLETDLVSTSNSIYHSLDF